MNRMQEKYNEEVVPALRKAFDLTKYYAGSAQ